MTDAAPPENPVVVELVDAGVPADQGLSALGMLMQLAGNLFGAYVALVVLGCAIARSMIHRSAGTQLLYGVGGTGEGNRLAGVKRYIWFALGQSLLTGAFIAWKAEAPTLALGLTLALAAWPTFLFVVLQLPRFKRFATEMPIAEDKGFEGAAILMTVLGLCGLVGGGGLLVVVLDLPGSALTKGPGVLVVLALAMLVVRSVIHVQAGLSGLRETSVDRSVELANRYANFGVISSFCAGGALLLFIMSATLDVTALSVVCGLVWMLMAWPLTVRRFFADRQFADLMAGTDAPVHRRAPDAGLSWLGWLLVAHGVLTGAMLLPSLVGSLGSGHGHLGGGLDSLLGPVGFAAAANTLWWSLGVVVLQGWAGFELVRMSAHSRIVATVYGGVAFAVTAYINWPVLREFKHMLSRGGPESFLLFLPLALALIIPISTLVLVHRKIAPTAQARFKPRAAE